MPINFIRLKAYVTGLLLLCSMAGFSQVTLTATSGTTSGSFTTLKGAFDAINAGTHQGAIVIRINASTTESASAVLNASGSSSSSYTSINIYPTTTGLSISGTLAAPLIELNGANGVTIDGRVNASGSTSLVITNNSALSTAGTSTIRFINDANNNTIKYCTVKGSSTDAAAGIVFFSTTTGTTGNDNNSIDHNDITCADDASRPLNAVYASGTSAKNNDNNSISNNNIYDFLNKATASNGISIASYNSAFTISGNSFYETAAFAATAAVIYSVIQISAYIGGNESGFTISGNYIGGSSPLGAGTAWTKTGQNNKFTAITVYTATGAANSIQGNTIQNIIWTNSGRTDFTGISVSNATIANIGTTTGNTIGSATGTGSINLTNGATSGNFYGINISSSGSVICSNNTIGSITTNNSTAYNTKFGGIYRSSSDGTTIISNNIIGSTTSAGSINASCISTAGSQSVYGIINAGNGTVTVSGNTIANMVNGSTAPAGGSTAGILAFGSANTISGNTVHDLSSTNTNSSISSGASVLGIVLSNTTTAAAQTVSGNTVYNLSNSSASFAGGVIGIYFEGTTTAGTVSGNFIHSLSVSGASSTAANLYGIKIKAGAATYSNNIISLGGNTTTNLYGIYETGAASNNNNLYFNTVYLSGSLAAGATNTSYALYSAVNTNSRDFRNNVLVNARSTASGASKHYGLYILSSGGTLTCDYNNYYVSGTGGMLGYYAADKSSATIVTDNDANSISTNPAFSSTGTTASGYLPTLLGTGVSGTGITVDYAGSLRAAPVTMGALTPCANPTSGGSIAAAQSGIYPLDPAAFTSTVAASGETGTIEYKWQLSTTSNSAGFNDIASSNAATYDAGALTQTTWYKRLARVTCKSDWIGAAESNVLEATVLPINSWSGVTSNDFNTASNWSNGTVPISTETFTITTGNPRLNVDYALRGSMTISGTGTLTINPGKTLSISGTAAFGGKSVTIQSDATGTGAIGLITGTLTGATNVTVERYIATAKRAWRLLSIPLSGTTIRSAWAGVTANASAPTGETAGSGTFLTGHGATYSNGTLAAAAGYDWYTGLTANSVSSIRFYNDANVWASATNTPDLLTTPDKYGYLVFLRGDRTVTTGSGVTTLRPTGTLKTGTQTMAISNSYEIIGNPYASSLYLDAVYNNTGNSSVIERNFWVWDATLGTSGAYRTLSYNTSSYDMTGGSGIAADYLKIQSGQAFFVARNTTGGNLTIEESNKTRNAGVVLLGAEPVITVGKVSISLYQATGSTLTTEMDGVLARFGSAYQTAPTDDYDVAKISNFNENLGLLRGDSYLSIESRPFPVKTDTLFAPFWNLTSRAYALKIGSTGMGGQVQGARLVDAFTKTETALNLNEGGTITYPFSVTADAASSSLDRFMIVMTAAQSLPVSFTNVNAMARPMGIDVSWKTGTEVNVKDYGVERSGDGITYAAINSKTALNATNGAAYNWLDLQPLTGKNYYRIRSNDRGGNYHYSGIVTANWNGKAGMGVYPTTINQGQFTVQLSNQPAGNYRLALTNITGRLLFTQSLSHAGGSDNYGVKTGSLAVSTGVYQLTITSPDGQQESFRLLITK